MQSGSKSFDKYAADILSSEINRVSVNTSAPTPVALVYPNTYAVGISNLGYQIVYRLFNEQPQLACERAFYYKGPLATSMRTLESRRQLRSFPIIAFSLAYELDYTNVLRILKTAGLQLLAKDRGDRDPLVIFGGVTTYYNPTPMAPFADAFLIGDAEAIIPSFANVVNQSRDEGLSKVQLLENLALLPGIYVPYVHGLACPNIVIERQHISDLSDSPSFSVVVGSKGHLNMFMVEVGRGCGRSCRFCVAGHVYRPVRMRSASEVLNIVEHHAFGSKRIGLVGAALSDFPQLGELVQKLVDRNYILGMSSLRVDSIDEQLLASLDASGVKSITLAPEAGTERLRGLIHKSINDGQIISAVQQIAQTNISAIKLYFMIGLPFEQEEDLQGIVTLVELINKTFRTGRGQRRLKVSINSFIPKPGTPFQWAPMVSEKELRYKRRWLIKRLRTIPGIYIVPKSVRQEIWQASLSLGDHRIGEEMLAWVNNGRSMRDGFIYDILDLDWITTEKEFSTPFPWDFISSAVSKNRLWQQWMKAKEMAASFN
jgi:radical SAM superfamily enzyme YgiQ (UPF0313 family)